MQSKLSDSDRVAVEKLRESVRDLLTPFYDTDFNLLRWLQGHDYKMDTILPKLRNHLILRQTWALDQVHFRKEKVLAKLPNRYYPGGCLGASGVDNTIVYLEPIGYFDLYGQVRATSRMWFFRSRMEYLDLWLAMLMEREAETGEQWHILAVFDMYKLTFHNDEVDAMQRYVSFLVQNYAELFSKIIIINAPTIFYYSWRIIAPFFPTKTVNKMDIASHNVSTETLLKYMKPNVLPVHYGGTRVDSNGDPRCELLIRYEKSRVPEAIYRDQFELENGIQLIVKAGKVEWVRVQSKGNSRLRWSFRASSTFSFCVFFAGKDEENGTEMVYPDMRNIVPTHCIEKDSIPNPRPGFYDFRFRNDAAWFRDLHIHYRIDMD